MFLSALIGCCCFISLCFESWANTQTAKERTNRWEIIFPLKSWLLPLLLTWQRLLLRWGHTEEQTHPAVWRMLLLSAIVVLFKQHIHLIRRSAAGFSGIAWQVRYPPMSLWKYIKALELPLVQMDLGWVKLAAAHICILRHSTVSKYTQQVYTRTKTQIAHKVRTSTLTHTHCVVATSGIHCEMDGLLFHFLPSHWVTVALGFINACHTATSCPCL